MSRLPLLASVAGLGLCLAATSCARRPVEQPPIASPAAPRGGVEPDRAPLTAVRPAGEIGFVSEGRLLTADTATGEVRDAFGMGSVQSFDWSPDGQEVVVATTGYPAVIRRIALLSGEAETVGAAGLEGTDPRWSPSGRALAFVVDNRETGSTVHIVPLADKSEPEDTAKDSETPLAPSGPVFRVGSNPEWSPDGRWLVYEREGSIRMLAVDGSEESEISLGVDECRLGSWSPDSRAVAYSGLDRGASSSSIFTSPAVKSARGRPLTSGLGDLLPAWSTDGTSVAFLRPIHTRASQAESTASDADLALWAVEARSGREERLTQEVVCEMQPSWSPDGGWVAFLSPDPDGSRVRLMVCSRDGSTVHHIADAAEVQRVRWRPTQRDRGEAGLTAVR